MGLQFLLPLLVPLVTPLLTEAVKRLMGLIVNSVPPSLVPNLSAVMGVLTVELSRAAGLDLLPGINSRQTEGIVALGLGYGGTGIHQALRTSGLTSATLLATSKKKMILLLLLGVLAFGLTA